MFNSDNKAVLDLITQKISEFTDDIKMARLANFKDDEENKRMLSPEDLKKAIPVVMNAVDKAFKGGPEISLSLDEYVDQVVVGLSKIKIPPAFGGEFLYDHSYVPKRPARELKNLS